MHQEAKAGRPRASGSSQGADAMVSMQQWVADTIYDITGTGDAANGSDGCSRQRV